MTRRRITRTKQLIKQYQQSQPHITRWGYNNKLECALLSIYGYENYLPDGLYLLYVHYSHDDTACFILNSADNDDDYYAIHDEHPFSLILSNHW